MNPEAVTYTPEPIAQSDYEALHGAYVKGLQLDLKGERKVGLVEFERGYLMQFENPTNPPELRAGAVTLSRAAFAALRFLMFCLSERKSDEQDAQDWDALMAALSNETLAKLENLKLSAMTHHE